MHEPDDNDIGFVDAPERPEPYKPLDAKGKARIVEHRARQREMRLSTCTHFNGIQHTACPKGVPYSSVRGVGPYAHACIRNECWETGGKPECLHFKALTVAEVDAEEARRERSARLLAAGKSPCCEADVDRSEVITEGPNKGHGPRFCSSCKQVVMWV